MAAAKRRRKDSNRAGKIWISMIVFAFVTVMSVQIVKIYRKDQEYIEKQQQLEEELSNETERQEEMEQYEEYTKTREYVEDVAKSKLGLAYPNEIIFKEE